MGVLCAIATMCCVFVAVLLLSYFTPKTAQRVLEASQNLFEPDQTIANTHLKPTHTKRPYLSPFTKRQVAARQKWRCAVCKQILDETYEIDHINPLFEGGSNDASNLQALCKRDHLSKTAMEQTRG